MGTTAELLRKARPFGAGGGKRYSLRAALLIALIPGLIGVLLTYWPPTEHLERTGLDLLFMLRGELPSPSQVCVVAIDDDSYWVRGIDPSKPWPRDLHADLIGTLKREGARAVAFDVLFVQEGDPEEDAAFERALSEAGNVVLGATVEQTDDPRFRRAQLIEPHERFAGAAAAVAEVNLPTDRDGVIRSTWLTHENRPSLALAAFQTATGDTMRFGGSIRYIDYYGPPRRVSTVSIYQALEPGEYLPPGFFRDKIVFVGLSQEVAAGPAAKDAFLTPFRGAGGRLTFGVEIHATVAANLLEGRRIDLLPRPAEILMILVLPLVAVLALMYLGPVLGLAAFLGLELLPWVGGYLAFTRAGIWLPVLIPAAIQLPMAYVLSLIWYYMTTARERERIRRAFSYYLSPEMSRQIAENPESLNVGGQEIVATCMFTDIRKFSSISEILTAPDTAAMLNKYFSDVTGRVFDTGGTLIKYIGDAVFAIWGAPIHHEDHAIRACRTAVSLVRMQEMVQEAPIGWLVTRIGVHSGSMLVGNLGSDQRFDYTAIGDAVNLAARLEGLNKAFGTLALVSGDTLDQTGDRFQVRPLGRARVVGRKEPVELYELLGEKGDEIKLTAEARSRFVEALDHYVAGRFAEAAEGFEEVRSLRGGKDGPSEFYKLLLAPRLRAPLPKDWDGIINFTSK